MRSPMSVMQAQPMSVMQIAGQKMRRMTNERVLTPHNAA